MQSVYDKIDLLSERMKALTNESNAATAHDMVLFDTLKNMLVDVKDPPENELRNVHAAMDDMIAHTDRMQQMVGTTPDLDTLRGMMTKQMDLVQNMQKAMYEMIATSAFEKAKKAKNDDK